MKNIIGTGTRVKQSTNRIEEKRKAEYIAKCLTPEKLIIALWEKVVEGRSEEADKLQAERQKVKEKYPKG